MHVLFVHKNFPAQFGHIAAYLAEQSDWRCTFVSETAPGVVAGVRKIQYQPKSGATESTHCFSRTFENGIWHAAGVYDSLKGLRKSLDPNLIVGHSGFGSTLFLTELFPQAPIVNLFEYFYHPHDCDMDFRPEFPPSEEDVLRSRARNAMIMLDLEYCQAGYAPTEFQRGLFPPVCRSKIVTLHDGVDMDFWRVREDAEELRDELGIAPDARIVTCCSRGFKAMRGFDIFMRVAKHVYENHPSAVFLVVGSDRVAYGGDLRFTGGKSFYEHVLSQDSYDLERIRFLGNVTPEALACLFSMSDLHIYLTVPFVLSWSMLDAMACGCTVLASDTAPGREVVRHNENGLLRDFFDVSALTATALEVLEDPADYADLGEEARRTIEERFSLDHVMPRMLDLYERAAARAV